MAKHHGVRKTVRKAAHSPTRIAHAISGKRSVGTDEMSGVGYGSPSHDTLDEELDKYLKKAAEVIAEYIRAEAARFSRRIPASVEVAKDHTVHVRAGGAVAPNAYPFDPPNNPPVWHPVFAHGPRHKWNWAPQPYRPFMEKGAERSNNESTEAFADIVDELAKRIGRDHP